MNPDILSQLKDITPPEPVGHWPLAWGWWLVIVLAIATIVALIVFTIKRHRLLKAKKQALNILTTGKNLTANEKVSLVNQVLKRVNLAYQNRHDIAELSGTHWANWLNQHDKNVQIDAELLTLSYQKECSDESAQLFYLQAQLWIKKALPLKPITITNNVSDATMKESANV